MININDIKNAIKEINLGEGFYYLAPKAFYDKNNEKVFILTNEDFYRYYDSKERNEDLKDNIVDKIIKAKTDYIMINVKINNLELAYIYSDLYKDDELKDVITNKTFKDFKELLIKKKLLTDFYEFKDKYLLTEAICFCNENNISYVS